MHERLDRAQLGGRARAAGREQVQRDWAAARRERRLEVRVIRVDRKAVPLVKPDAPRGQLRLWQLRLQAGGLIKAREQRVEHLPADAAIAAGGVYGKVLEKDKAAKVPRRHQRLHAAGRRAQNVDVVGAVRKQRALPRLIPPLPGREAPGQQTENRVKILRAHTLDGHHSASSFSISAISPRSR